MSPQPSQPSQPNRPARSSAKPLPSFVHQGLFFVRAPDEGWAKKLLSRQEIRLAVVARLSPTEFLFAKCYMRVVRARLEELKLPIRLADPRTIALRGG